MPSFCWHCGKPLAKVGGQLVARPVYAQGAFHDVHVVCVEAAVAEERAKYHGTGARYSGFDRGERAHRTPYGQERYDELFDDPEDLDD